MPQVTFQQGEDLVIKLPIEDASTPVDITTATSIRVQAYINKSNVKVKAFAYSKNPKSGYGDCRQSAVGGEEHIVDVLVTRAQSVNFDVGVLSFAVVLTFPNVDFPDGENKEYNFDAFGNVTEGCAKDEVIP